MLRPAVTPRRVLMTCDAVGGVWSYAVDLAAAFKRAGIHVLLVGSGPRPDATRAASAPADLEWLDCDPVWLDGGAASAAALATGIARLARGFGADIVHLNQPGEAARLYIGAPVVVGAHSCLATWWHAVRGGAPPGDWEGRIALERDGLKRSAAVLAPSRSFAAALAVAHGLPADAIHVVPNAVAQGPAPRARRPFVLAAARWWDPAKNLAALDAAAARCPWPVVACGSRSGPGGAVAGVAEHVVARDQVAPEALRAVMAEAAVFVSPSLYEPFGLAALEAAGAGAALLLADIPSYRELWQGAARFFDPRDPEALADALRDLAADDAARRALAAAARARAAAFSPERQVRGVRAVHEAVLRTLRVPDLAAV